MRQLIMVEGFELIEDLANALPDAKFASGQSANGWVIGIDDILFKAEMRDNVFGKYREIRLLPLQCRQTNLRRRNLPAMN